MSNKHTTALNKFIGLDWAINSEWLDNAKNVMFGERADFATREEKTGETFEALAARMNGEQVSQNMFVAGRTAVIDIYGAIMPRANWMSDYSGGASCELLARDVKAAMENPLVENILFSIHSPGGEVTGVSELAGIIAEAEKRTCAYVSGMGCSAAYWIASACDSIIANPTAVLGSIGVMAVYTDKSKALKNIGVEEIEFISSQSPYKNAKPTTDEGRAKIQARVDSLAQVFIESVAENRNVSVDTVLEKFGQGGVMVGKDAVKAGLADEIGNFESAMQIVSGQKQVERPKKEQIIMAEQETATVAVDKTEFEAMQKMLAELSTANEQNAAALKNLQAEKAALEAEKLSNELKAISDGWAGEQTKHLTVLNGLVSAFGKDSKEFAAYVENQKALSAQIEASSVFEEFGTNRGGEEKTAYEQLTEKAKEIQTLENCSFESAMTKAAANNPALYKQYSEGK